MYNNFGFVHKSGILMPISSLPCKYGIGDFGNACYNFIDFLHASGQQCWQVLPLNPTAYGDSPYQSPSSFAGNPYFVSLVLLAEENLLTSDELKEAEHDSDEVDYGWLFVNRYDILRKAYARFVATDDYNKFLNDNSRWLDDYALFMALKVKFGYAPWFSWESEYKYYDKAKKHIRDFEEECGFWKFVQFKFFKQWGKVREYAEKNAVRIIGDMPIYVAHDSVDVWSNPTQFLLDEDLNPTVVAGCPPDGFSPDGQLWGNPIYDWAKMQKSGFKWWIARIKHGLSLYNVLRIDHFRGFAGYYVVPFGEDTARNGHWEVGVGKLLFDDVFKEIGRAKIIAEDLGFITDDVRELLSYTGFPGMKVLQFAFFDDDAEYLPRNYGDENCIVYTGTHDADATKEWCDNLSGDTKRRFVKECMNVVYKKEDELDEVACSVDCENRVENNIQLENNERNNEKGAENSANETENCTEDMANVACDEESDDESDAFINHSAVLAMIMLALKSKANLAVIPLQDYMEIPARINRPSIPYGNWVWRIRDNDLTDELKDKILQATKESGRSTI